MRRVIADLLTALGVLLALLIAANAWVIGASRKHVHEDWRQLPVHDVGLVLGTSPFTRYGSPNLLFKHRIKAAAQLYEAGRVKHLLLSGANPDQTYNEPRKMYQALAKAGVPDTAMTLDFAGFRTLDSIVRANRVFGLERFTIISQRYHGYRAVFIARHYGFEAVAYSHPQEDRRQPLRTEAREFLARAVAVADLFLFRASPRFLGERRQLEIEPATPAADEGEAGQGAAAAT